MSRIVLGLLQFISSRTCKRFIATDTKEWFCLILVCCLVIFQLNLWCRIRSNENTFFGTDLNLKYQNALKTFSDCVERRRNLRQHSDDDDDEIDFLYYFFLWRFVQLCPFFVIMRSCLNFRLIFCLHRYWWQKEKLRFVVKFQN